MCYSTSQEFLQFPRTFQEESWEKIRVVFVLYANVNENLYVEYFACFVHMGMYSMFIYAYVWAVLG